MRTSPVNILDEIDITFQSKRSAKSRPPLKLNARETFAELNGWRIAKAHAFSLRTLVKGKFYDSGDFGGYGLTFGFLDHPEWYRLPDRRSAAVVAHTYVPVDSEQFMANCARIKILGLVVHTPGSRAHSWYYPHNATVVCITRPDTTVVQWLPPASPRCPIILPTPIYQEK